MPRTASPFRLPAIAHVQRAPRHDEIVFGPEEHVAACQDLRAVVRGGEIDLVRQSADALPVGDDPTMEAKPGHPTIGEDVETHVGESERMSDREDVLAIARELRLPENLDPLCFRGE